MTPVSGVPALRMAQLAEAVHQEEEPLVLHACQEGENDHAEVVVVYEPEGTSLMMGGLHPRVSVGHDPNVIRYRKIGSNITDRVISDSETVPFAASCVVRVMIEARDELKALLSCTL